MYNLYRFGSHALETAKATLTYSARCHSKRIYEDLEYTNNDEGNKRKHIKHKRCSQSEPMLNQDNQRDTSLISAALHAVEILDSKQHGQISEIPTQSNQNQSINPSVLKNYNENPSKSNPKQFNLSGDGQNEPDNNERQYIINVFLNDHKPKETKDNSVDIHINNIGVTSDEVCMHKLTKNIHKSYTEIDNILNDNINFNENRSELAKELKRVWSDVFKQSKVEDFELTEQTSFIEDHDASKDDEDLSDESDLKNQSVITVDEELDSKDIQDDLERKSDEAVVVNPITTAAELDEVIKKNALYKKTRIKRNVELVSAKQESRESKIEIKKATIDSIQMKKMAEPIPTKPDTLPAENVKLKTQKVVGDPVVISSNLIKEKVVENQNKPEINLVKDTLTSSKELFQNTAIKPQEAFDPEPISDEFNISTLGKALAEQQLNKNKVNVVKDEAVVEKEPSPRSRKFVKPREREIIDVLPPDDNVLPPITRPIPLTLGKRLKYHNEQTQKQIEDIIKMSALPPESQKTINRVVTFCKDLLKDNQLRSRLPKFLQNVDFVDKKIGSKNIFIPENSTMNMQYSSFIQTRSKIDDQSNTNQEKPDQSGEISSVVSNEEESFQQRCGVRERILPKPRQSSNYYRMGQRRLSYSRRILAYSKLWGKRPLKTWQRMYCSKSDETEAKDDKAEVRDDKAEPKDDKEEPEDPKDPCAKLEAKAELKPCESRVCKAEEDGEAKKVNKCESPELIKQISEGVLDCTSKCLANRSADESGEPEPQQIACRDSDDPRYKQQVPAEEPKCDIMDQIGKYVSNEKDFEQVECYYGDNGYKNLEYFKYFPTSFYDINAYMSKQRNPQPDANFHKKTKKKDSCNF